MKVSRSDHRVRTAAHNVIEILEGRQLLSATLTTAIPAQSLTTSQSPVSLTLGNYFDDSAVTSGDTVVNLVTNLASPNNSIPLELTTAATPKTVANFLKYISSGEYANTIFHRSVPNFVIQGGGFTTDGTQITSFGAINGEYTTATEKNATPGTIAMALSTGPNSGTSEWFINLADNSTLDTGDGGPFTAFGQTLYNGLTVADDIAALPVVNDTANGAFNTLPVQNLSNGATVTSVPTSDFVTINPVVVPDGLNFSVTSSNPSVVTTSISGGNLSLTPAATGTTNITVTATDLGGGTTQSTFAVTVAATAAPTVSIANASATLGSASQILFPVTVSPASTSAITVDYTLAASTAPSTDFTSTASSLTIPAGATTANIPVTVIGDSTGTSETFVITLTSVSSGATFANGASTTSATGTINPAAVAVATTTTLQASASAVAAGDTDTFVATITPAVTGTTVAGTVTFSVNGTSVGVAGVTNGTASLTIPLSTPGSQSVTAVYGGSSACTASTSAAITVNVSTLAPVIGKSTLPTTVVTGETARGSIVVTATNSTASTLKGTATINIYATTTGVVDTNSILVATVKRAVNLKAGALITIPVPIKSLPTALTTASYTLLAETIDPQSKTSYSATGPGLVLQAPALSLTTTVPRVAALPTTAISGAKTPAVASVLITNSGNVTSSGLTTITLYASTDGTVALGTVLKTITRKLSIPVGKSVVVAVPLGAYPLAADGSYFIVAQVTDPKGGLSSNDFATPVTIAPAQIDLSNTLTTVPAKGKIGKTIAVTLDLTNKGTVTAAGKLQIAFSLSPNSDGSSPVALKTITTRINLRSSQTVKLHLKVLLAAGTTTAGNLYLVSDVDPNNVFNDTSLSNNTSVSPSFITVS